MTTYYISNNLFLGKECTETVYSFKEDIAYGNYKKYASKETKDDELVEDYEYT